MLKRYRSARNAGIFSEDFAGKRRNFGLRSAPGIARQACFVAGFLEKFLARQLMFRRHLGKQQATVIFRGDQEPVFADLDFMKSDGKKIGKYGDLNFQAGKFFGTQRRKTRIAEGGALRAMNDAFAKLLLRFYHTNTAAQLSVNFEGYEKSLAQGKTGGLGSGLPQRSAFERADDGGTRQRKHGPALPR